VRNKIIAFDLDDVLCYRTTEKGKIEKYHSCRPIEPMIKITNQCYDEGNTVIIYTARGMTGFKGNVNDIYSNLYELTLNQLAAWDVKYHQLIMGKIHYDLLIDDKAVNSIDIKEYEDIKSRFGGL
jgi:hypothetical protein